MNFSLPTLEISHSCIYLVSDRKPYNYALCFSIDKISLRFLCRLLSLTYCRLSGVCVHVRVCVRVCTRECISLQSCLALSELPTCAPVLSLFLGNPGVPPQLCLPLLHTC